MKKIAFFLLLPIIFLQIKAYAQLSEDFADGDFSNNPEWSGEVTKFIVESGQLRLDAPRVSDMAYLSTPANPIDNAEWIFSVAMDFNPSANNFAKTYLVSDNSNLRAALNGYFVKMGGSDDEISLFRQDGFIETKIIDGMDKRIDKDNVELSIKVTRDDRGQWALFSDVDLGGSFIQEGTAQDATYRSALFFGFLCQYTTTRSDRFRFDDIEVRGTPFVDDEAPTLFDVTPSGERSLILDFSEPMAREGAENTTNYEVSNGIGPPLRASLDPGNPNRVRLDFDRAFSNAITYTLGVEGLEDRSGNELLQVDRSFTYFETTLPGFNDVIITEVFADESFDENGPLEGGLGDNEYIELHNRSKRILDLNGLVLEDATGKTTFSNIKIGPGDYLIVAADITQLETFGPAYDLPNFPSLNNRGETLTLRSMSGSTVFSVNYTDDWYKDSGKREGGWSLEMIDTDNPCGGIDNWTAAIASKGGTPGSPNSVSAERLDLTKPSIERIVVNSGDSITVLLTEKMDSSTLASAEYRLEPFISIDERKVIAPGFQQVGLKLSSVLLPHTVYVLSLENARDCSRNLIDTGPSAPFARPERGVLGDILLNEILFRPEQGGVEFVELYNHSDKYIDIANWSLLDKSGDGSVLGSNTLVMAPRAYRVFTKDRFLLKGQYPFGKEENFVEVPDMPTFNNDKDTVLLLDKNGILMDLLEYEDDFHHPLLEDTEGVALERVVFDAPTNTAANWKSAASQVGFATPGYKNSQLRESRTFSGEVTLDREVFVPDNSGRDDFVAIHYRFDFPGLLATVRVYDALGREVGQLARNELLATEGFYTWDGTGRHGRKVRTGYYIILFETFSPSGEQEVFKRKVVLGSRF